MVYCAKCGAELNEEARFCSACGTSVKKTTSEEVSVASENLIKRVKEIIHEGNVTRIIIKNENDKLLLEIPATVGVIGVLFAPWLAALGTIAGIATNAKLIIIREE